MRGARFILGFWIAVACLTSACSPNSGSPKNLPPGSAPDQVENFILLDESGKGHELQKYAEAKAIVIIGHGNGCPIIQKYFPLLERMRSEFGPKGVVFLFLNANTQDDRASVAKEAKNFDLAIPILRDPSQTITQALGMKQTGETILIDPKTWRVVYQGAVDDRFGYGTTKPKAENNYLKDALEEVLAGRPVKVARSQARGCLFSFPTEENYTYVNHVAPILKAKCIACHSVEGRPPIFSDYKQAKGWAAMSRQEVRMNRMPPWQADPEGKFETYEMFLTPEETRTLVRWAELGAPRGEGEDPLVGYKLVTPPPITEKPVLTVSMPKAESFPAEGFNDYTHYQLGGPAERDILVGAFELESSHFENIHHATIWITERPLSAMEELYSKDLQKIGVPLKSQEASYGFMQFVVKLEAEKEGFFPTIVYAPGRPRVTRYGKDVAVLIPKGWHIILQAHYASNGKAFSDQAKLNVYEWKGKGKPKILRHGHVGRRDFVIPAGEPDFRLSSTPTVIKDDIYILGFTPHMHLRGKSLRLFAKFPNGKKEELISFPIYNFLYQRSTNMKERIFLPKGTSLTLDAAWDNSRANHANPDPQSPVPFGHSTIDREMGHLNFGYLKAKE